jgi:hypothetical protein
VSTALPRDAVLRVRALFRVRVDDVQRDPMLLTPRSFLRES